MKRLFCVICLQNMKVMEHTGVGNPYFEHKQPAKTFRNDLGGVDYFKVAPGPDHHAYKGKK